MSEELSNGEIARQLADLKLQVASGFAGTHGRLDRVNGQLDNHREKLGNHATALAEHRIRLSTLSNHIFRRRNGTGADADVEDDTPGKRESKPITRGDLVFVGGVVFALVEAVRWLPALVSIGRVAP